MTPLGLILNRFSADTNIIDQVLKYCGLLRLVFAYCHLATDEGGELKCSLEKGSAQALGIRTEQTESTHICSNERR